MTRIRCNGRKRSALPSQPGLPDSRVRFRWYTDPPANLRISPTESAEATYDRRMRRSIYTEDHELFRQSVRTFIEREVTPNFERWERDGIVDRELFTAAGAADTAGWCVLRAAANHGLSAGVVA